MSHGQDTPFVFDPDVIAFNSLSFNNEPASIAVGDARNYDDPYEPREVTYHSDGTAFSHDASAGACTLDLDRLFEQWESWQ